MKKINYFLIIYSYKKEKFYYKMKEIKYTYKCKLKPTTEQEILLSKYFGSVRYVLNNFTKNDI